MSGYSSASAARSFAPGSLLRFRRGQRRRSWRCSATGLVAVPLSVGLQGLDALELPLSGLQQKAAWETGLKTAYGLTAIAAAFALIAGLFGVRGKIPARGPQPVAGGPLGTGLALALSGHAGTAEPRLVSRAAVFLHGVGVAFWIGSLLPLYAAVRAAAVRDRRSAGMQLDVFRARSCRRSWSWSRAASGWPGFSSVASMHCGPPATARCSRASLSASPACWGSPRPTVIALVTSSRPAARRRHGRSRPRSRSSLPSRS